MMMNWRKGMFLLFDKNVAKITRVENGLIKMRKFSKGQTENGYSFQHECTVKHLDKLLGKEKLIVLKSEEILACIFHNYIGDKNK